MALHMLLGRGATPMESHETCNMLRSQIYSEKNASVANPTGIRMWGVALFMSDDAEKIVLNSVAWRTLIE